MKRAELRFIRGRKSPDKERDNAGDILYGKEKQPGIFERAFGREAQVGLRSRCLQNIPFRQAAEPLPIPWVDQGFPVGYNHQGADAQIFRAFPQTFTEPEPLFPVIFQFPFRNPMLGKRAIAALIITAL